VGPEVLLAIPDGDDVVRLSVPASAVWLALDDPRDRASLLTEIASVFDVEPTEIADHVDRLVAELVARGWVLAGTEWAT
jgi:hypothetical protein